jgi:hypothetical protein
MASDLPKAGDKITTPDGKEGVVVAAMGANMLVRMPDGSVIHVPLANKG